MAHAVHRHLPLLHGFQKRRLGTGGGAVKLIRQKQVRQHRTGLVAQSAGLGIGDAVAGDVRGQHIGGKLNAAVVGIDKLRESLDGQGLCQTGTPSSRMWPSLRRPIRRQSTRCFCPTITLFMPITRLVTNWLCCSIRMLSSRMSIDSAIILFCFCCIFH